MNIKHISLAISAVAIASLIAACTKNQIDDSTINIGSADLDGQLVDLELASVSSTGTKAVIEGTDFPQTGEIGLFLFEDEQATKAYGTGYENVKYSYNSTKSKWTASQSIKVGSTPGYLYGYYPYSSTATDIKAIPVSSSLNGDDVMYAAIQAAITDKTASQTTITMNHALARVSISVKNNGYTGEAKLSQIKFEGAKLAASGTLDATSGSITATTADNVVLSVPEAGQTIATGDGTTYECLLVPSEASSDRQDVTLSLTIDGQVKTLKLSGNDNGVVFKQNTKSTVTITLSNTGIALQTVSVEGWNVVEVGGHKVTVKEAEDVTPHDVLTEVYVDGNTAKIVAISLSKTRLECKVTGTAEISRSISDNVFTFTVSGISENTTATIGYEKSLTVTVSYNTAWGTAKYEGLPFIGEEVTFTATAKEGHSSFIKWQDADGKDLDWTNPMTITLSSDITAIAVFEPNDALSGVFTVSDDGNGNVRKVRFSKGNLYYNGSSWNFEANQYDFRTYQGLLSCIDGTISDSGTPTNNWGQFGWVGASSTKFDTAPEIYGVSTSKEKSDYGNVDYESLKSDWGATIDDMWRTLTIDEWGHLLTGRANAADKKGLATVGGVSGLIILPDAFNDPMKNNGNKAFVPSPSSYTNNEYTTGENGNWEAMETAGAVFFPATPYRNGNVLYGNIENQGFYWSSSSGQDMIYADNNLNAYYIFFRVKSINERQFKARFQGKSVRLVTDVKE